ncbi:MAG: hypothetical protein M1820_009802 [Bogoriella megaspora]|nr:MAG: hypothetical protein M1820_009802 [Bogoriella megaspora]
MNNSIFNNTSVTSPRTQSRYETRKRPAISYAEIDSETDSEAYKPDSVAKFLDLPARKKLKRSLPKREIFPFLQLPLELRDQIYKELLLDSNAVYLVSKMRQYRHTVRRAKEFGEMGATHRSYRWSRIPRSRAFSRSSEAAIGEKSESYVAFTVTILAVNSTIRTEAEAWLYSRNKFVFEDSTALHSFLAVQSLRHRHLIRDVTINAWDHGRAHKAMNLPSFTLLATCLNLRRLKIDCAIIWGGRDMEKLVARKVYRDGFHFLEAVAQHRSTDEAVAIIEMNEKNWPGRRTSYRWKADGSGSERFVEEAPGNETSLAKFRSELKFLMHLEGIRFKAFKRKHGRVEDDETVLDNETVSDDEYAPVQKHKAK